MLFRIFKVNTKEFHLRIKPNVHGDNVCGKQDSRTTGL